ncbi:MAG: prepilin-type N-terminal cleavage/methylation domain-containing protein [Syntrophobacterales bacterium]|nr:prepilin-type N-terminal cleavage/methylation domain-containing protein [Syntrophobacterales bacterium]
MACGGNRGFTLLELLISLTILSLITLLVFGAFRIGIRAWEKGERNIDGRQRERIVLDLIKRQLASIPVDTVKGEKALALKGDSKSVEFVSDIHLVPGDKFGMVYVKYRVEEGEDSGEILSFSEKNVVMMMGKDADMDDSDDLFIELLRGAGMVFEYLKNYTDEETPQWQESWNSEDDPGFPVAVRITLTRSDDDIPICVIARIAADAG